MIERSFPSNLRRLIWPAVILAAAVNAYAWYYVSREVFVYYWDYVTYWVKADKIAEGLRHDPLLQYLKLFISLRKDDYNDLAAWPLALWHQLFGPGRLSYILSITNLYAIPAALSFLWLRLDQGPIGSRQSPKRILGVLGIVAIYPFFWDPVLNGYLDVCGVLMTNAALYLYWRYPWQDRQPLRRLVFLGIAMALAMSLRRWYAVWVESFFIVTFAAALIRYFTEREHVHRLTYLKNWLTVLFSTAVIFAGITFPMPIRIALTNYSEALQAMKTTARFDEFLVTNLFVHFGLFQVGVFLAGFAVAALSRSSQVRHRAYLLMGQWAVIFTLFFRMQDFGTHHYYLVLPGMLLFQIHLMRHLRYLIPRLAVAAGLLYCFVSVLEPAFLASSLRTELVSPTRRHYPQRRFDLNELESMRRDLLDVGASSDRPVYVLAGSRRLNSDTLRQMERSMGLPRQIEPAILRTRSVDGWDGYPVDFFKASFVIVPDTAHYHLAPQFQRSVGLIWECFDRGDGVSRAFERLPGRYRLWGGSTAAIYRRIREITPLERQDLDERFFSIYPHWRTT